MTAVLARQYINLLEDSEKARAAFLACSAALRLDDEIAYRLIESATQNNNLTDKLLNQIKSLGCVWKQWDGTWHIAEDVRPHLAEQMSEELPEAIQLELRQLLAAHSKQKFESLSPDGQITTYRARQAKFEAAFQETLIPEQSKDGAKQFAELWEHSSQSVKEATAQSVDYLAPEISRHLQHIPTEVLFLQGMAARKRRDKNAQEKYFRAVWGRGNSGYISAIAAHLYGLIMQKRNPRVSERAFLDSIQWNKSSEHRGQVYHSLGNLLSKNRARWAEAERAYERSIELADDSFSRGQRMHSLGNLLSKDRARWAEAERAYERSIELDSIPRSQAETLHSLGNLLSKDRARWAEAERAYERSIKLADSFSRGQGLHSLGNLLSKDRARWAEAERAYERSIELADDSFSRGQRMHSLGNFLANNLHDWDRAETAYMDAVELLQNDPYDHAQVIASWANALSKDKSSANQKRSEELALESLKIDPRTARTNAVCYQVLADVYENRGEIDKAIQALETVIELDRKQGKRKFEARIKERIFKLRAFTKNPKRKINKLVRRNKD